MTMNLLPSSLAGAAALIAAVSFSPTAGAVTIPVAFNTLNASATVATPLVAGDTLFVDTLVANETGALNQAVTFTLSTPSFLSGAAAWQISTAGGTGPRLVGVNIDLFNASNSLVATDNAPGTLGGFAVSEIPNTPLNAGVYTLRTTGTAVRATSLDISLTVTAVPEPETYALMLAGLAAVGFVARRRASHG